MAKKRNAVTRWMSMFFSLVLILSTFAPTVSAEELDAISINGDSALSQDDGIVVSDVVPEQDAADDASVWGQLAVQMSTPGGSVKLTTGDGDIYEIEPALQEDGSVLVSVFDGTDTLIDQNEHAAGEADYIFEAENGSIVTVEASAPEGMAIDRFGITKDGQTVQPDDFIVDAYGSFEYAIVMDGETTLSLDFVNADGIELTDYEYDGDVLYASDIVEMDGPVMLPTEDETEISDDEIIIEEETETFAQEDQTETVEFETEVAETEPEIGAVVETEAETEVVTEAAEVETETVEVETEGFDFDAAVSDEGLSVSDLDADDFNSGRLLVRMSEGLSQSVMDTIIMDPEHVIGSYNNLYLLQYDTVEEAMSAYVYYQNHAETVEPDGILTVQSGIVKHSVSQTADFDMVSGANPIADLSVLPDIEDTGDTVVALIDDGISTGGNVISSVSMIGDSLDGLQGHASNLVHIMQEIDPDINIVSVRVMDDYGIGTVSSIVAGIRYAIEQNVDIINLSLSGKFSIRNTVVENEIQDAIVHGIKVVAAAGNNGDDAANYVPGRVVDAYVAGVCDDAGVRLASSNYGDTVDYYLAADTTSESAAKLSALFAKYGYICEIDNLCYSAVHTLDPDDISVDDSFDPNDLMSGADIIDQQVNENDMPEIALKFNFYDHANEDPDRMAIGVETLRLPAFDQMDGYYWFSINPFRIDIDELEPHRVAAKAATAYAEDLTDETLYDKADGILGCPEEWFTDESWYATSDLSACYTVDMLVENTNRAYQFLVDDDYKVASTPDEYKYKSEFDDAFCVAYFSESGHTWLSSDWHNMVESGSRDYKSLGTYYWWYKKGDSRMTSLWKKYKAASLQYFKDLFAQVGARSGNPIHLEHMNDNDFGNVSSNYNGMEIDGGKLYNMQVGDIIDIVGGRTQAVNTSTGWAGAWQIYITTGRYGTSGGGTTKYSKAEWSKRSNIASWLKNKTIKTQCYGHPEQGNYKAGYTIDQPWTSGGYGLYLSTGIGNPNMTNLTLANKVEEPYNKPGVTKITYTFFTGVQTKYSQSSVGYMTCYILVKGGSTFKVHVHKVSGVCDGITTIAGVSNPLYGNMAGAQFKVYDKSTDSAIGKVLTCDETGLSQDITLSDGTYYLKEVKAPPGYKMANSYNGKKNQRPKGAVQIDSASMLTSFGKISLSKYNAKSPYTVFFTVEGDPNYEKEAAVAELVVTDPLETDPDEIFIHKTATNKKGAEEFAVYEDDEGHCYKADGTSVNASLNGGQFTLTYYMIDADKALSSAIKSAMKTGKFNMAKGVANAQSFVETYQTVTHKKESVTIGKKTCYRTGWLSTASDSCIISPRIFSIDGNLPAGVFKLEETSCPVGYTDPITVWFGRNVAGECFYITDDGQSVSTLSNVYGNGDEANTTDLEAYADLYFYKVDAETGSERQGDAHFKDCKFEIINASGRMIKLGNNVEIPDGGVCCTLTSDESGRVTTEGLGIVSITNEFGRLLECKSDTKYIVREVLSNKQYGINVNDGLYQIVLGRDHKNQLVPLSPEQYTEPVRRGGLYIQKKDRLFEDNNKYGDTDLNGVVYAIVNGSENPIKTLDGRIVPSIIGSTYSGKKIESEADLTYDVLFHSCYNSLTASGQIDLPSRKIAGSPIVCEITTDSSKYEDGYCETLANELPYGTYYVIELIPPHGYLVDTHWIGKAVVHEDPNEDPSVLSQFPTPNLPMVPVTVLKDLMAM